MAIADTKRVKDRAAASAGPADELEGNLVLADRFSALKQKRGGRGRGGRGGRGGGRR